MVRNCCHGRRRHENRCADAHSIPVSEVLVFLSPVLIKKLVIAFLSPKIFLILLAVIATNCTVLEQFVKLHFPNSLGLVDSQMTESFIAIASGNAIEVLAKSSEVSDAGMHELWIERSGIRFAKIHASSSVSK
jgi:hypothetical protein